MGRKKRESPARLAEKLLSIRIFLNLSQRDMYAALHPDKEDSPDMMKSIIYAYEKGKRIPSLFELLGYTKVLWQMRRVRLNIDDLVDDDVNLTI